MDWHTSLVVIARIISWYPRARVLGGPGFVQTGRDLLSSHSCCSRVLWARPVCWKKHHSWITAGSQLTGTCDNADLLHVWCLKSLRCKSVLLIEPKPRTHPLVFSSRNTLLLNVPSWNSFRLETSTNFKGPWVYNAVAIPVFITWVKVFSGTPGKQYQSMRTDNIHQILVFVFFSTFLFPFNGIKCCKSLTARFTHLLHL